MGASLDEGGEIGFSRSACIGDFSLAFDGAYKSDGQIDTIFSVH